ncbi:MurR/RpiR family transcriptional regulator [Martelella alba]|uniref:MurR/RpiR family transcriptional regulator n=1 Tax=Martelella alba TaxID=2590451 RepID=A0ABY2SGS6_9HYPH|nr:MurR/RpiR family transcriptional regulator [Martelella alba]TKI03317.1 MurR/RpiR family transcriptional regulator [Martelella alba]
MKPFDERLRAAYARLSPQEQRIAGFIIDNLDDMTSYNSAELARLSGVSKATASRLFRRLGYANYRQVRDELRTLRQSGMPVVDRGDATRGDTLLARHYKQEMFNLAQWVNGLDSGQFAEAIRAMGRARRLCLVGLRNSYPVAMHLRQQLQHIRDQVGLLPQPGQTLAEEIVDLGVLDLMIVVAFRRRSGHIAPLLTQLRNRRVPVLLLSEPQARSLTSLVRWHFTVPLDSVSAFDAYSSAMSLVSLISNALLHDALESGRQRIRTIAGMYAALNELERRD